MIGLPRGGFRHGQRAGIVKVNFIIAPPVAGG